MGIIVNLYSEFVRKNITSLILIVVLLAGLSVTLYLTRTQRNFTGKAASEISNIIEVTDPNGSVIAPNGNAAYSTNTNKVILRVK